MTKSDVGIFENLSSQFGILHSAATDIFTNLHLSCQYYPMPNFKKCLFNDTEWYMKKKQKTVINLLPYTKVSMK